jgi:hypothetical protein
MSSAPCETVVVVRERGTVVAVRNDDAVVAVAAPAPPVVIVNAPPPGNLVIAREPGTTLTVSSPGRGPAGADGTSGGYFHHVQSLPVATWYIVHNLGYNPAVSVTDSAGDMWEGHVTYVTTDALTITFHAPFSGVADLS